MNSQSDLWSLGACGVQRSVQGFLIRPLAASRLRRAEVGSRGDRQDEGMSRRSSRYKGGVSRGREELPQGNSTMKRGSPTTKRAGSKSNTDALEIRPNKGCQKIGDFDPKNGNIFGSVKSFGLGSIFPPSLGYNLSRNALVGPFLFPERNSDWRKDFA